VPTLAAVQEAVIDVLKDVSRRPIDPVPESDLIADLGFDSLQIVEVASALEGRFDITIPLDDLGGTRTAAQIALRVHELIGERVS
jgi:acyl carrier protein